jgi:hypothetical protein
MNQLLVVTKSALINFSSGKKLKSFQTEFDEKLIEAHSATIIHQSKDVHQSC